MSGTPQQVVASLARRGFQHAYVDGGLTIQSLLRDGLNQRLTIARIPAIIGAGIRLGARTTSDVMLMHIETRQYASSLVKSECVILT